VHRSRRFSLFHNKQQPSQLGLREAIHFLERIVKTAPEPLPALAQARSALALLYGRLLGTTWVNCRGRDRRGCSIICGW